MKVAKILFILGAIILGAVFVSMDGAKLVLDMLDGLLIALIAVMMLDIMTGLVSAWMGKSINSDHGGFSSKAFWRGVISKSLILMVVALASFIDMAIENNIVRDVVILFYLFEEGLSVLENCSMAGLPIPKKLKNVLESLNKDLQDDRKKK